MHFRVFRGIRPPLFFHMPRQKVFHSLLTNHVDKPVPCTDHPLCNNFFRVNLPRIDILRSAVENC